MGDSGFMHIWASVKKEKKAKRLIAAILPIFALLVTISVFWWLKLTGITMAGEAFCGREEHIHSDLCMESVLICTEDTAAADASGVGHAHTDECYESALVCETEEHIHVSACYSDITADLETAEDWEATLSGLSPNLSAGEKIVAVARSQLGYVESERNFTVNSEDERHGYTRYGAWYGNPYGEWSTMFTSFCLSYGGADVPVGAGAETVRILWEEEEKFHEVYQYTPVPGDVVFLDKNGNGTADATAIITGLSDGVLSVIEGDLDNKVAETTYAVSDAMVMGYGASVQGNNLLMMSAPLADAAVIATTVSYTSYGEDTFSVNDSFVLYTQSGGNYYALDGSGNAVQITIDSGGNITCDVTDPNTLLWILEYKGDYQQPNNSYTSDSAYYIQNVATGNYLHPSADGGSVLLSGRWESGLIPNGTGVRLRGARQNVYAVLSGSSFVGTTTQSNASTFYFGKAPTKYAVWLDGTNGGLMGLGGSPNQSYLVEQSATVKLPETWQSPDKYSYVLHGWFDIKNNKYYKPGAEITVTESLVLYADWWAQSYDVGQYNEFVSNTVSTNSFITTDVFDYNSLFNLQSLKPTVSANVAGHTETWSMVTSGPVPYQDKETLNFIFCDYDADGDISYASGRGEENVNRSVVTAGLYNDRLGEILFDKTNAYDPETGKGILGKKYLGTADHLFHFDSDPNSSNRGYYYYDSKLHAASYNQSDACFYVYDYLERTSDSKKDGGGGEYSDFLPFNSPYVNTNGQAQATYTYDGENGEYAGVTHYQYDAKYDGQESYAANIGTNYWFGMSIDIRFYLSNDPGEMSDGTYGNRDLYGNEMHFKFSGDDDLWVLIDGQPVLDVGGVHGIKNGDINFSTGSVVVEGTETGLLQELGFTEGEHTLTVYYLERGSSQSNCAIYFNIAPRFNFTIQKEDVLSSELLNGAEFTVYADRELTTLAPLWTSEEAYRNGEAPAEKLAIVDGKVSFWGMTPGKTYYIVETKPPDNSTGDALGDYSLAHGIICVSLDYFGKAEYTVEFLEERDENDNPIEISKGYTVHGFRIDEETQEAYIVITNGHSWITEVTSVQAIKQWEDTEDHTTDSVTVYMTVTYEDGTVKRIREVELSEANNWTYIWTNLPKYWADGATLVEYGIEEAYEEGYFGVVEQLDKIEIDNSGWKDATEFTDGDTFLIQSRFGYLATSSATNADLVWITDRAEAESSVLAQWTADNVSNASASQQTVKLTNGAGQILTYNHGSRNNNRYYYATASTTNYQTLTFDFENGRFCCAPSSTTYYLNNVNISNGRITTTTSSRSAMVFDLYKYVEATTELPISGYAYRITNMPLENVTSVTVDKIWDGENDGDSRYDKFQVTVKLLANGKDTGRTVVLSLKNGWTDTFDGLPYTDVEGNVIQYTIEEIAPPDNWKPTYGDRITADSDPPTYHMTVTNTYDGGYTVELPSTGGYGWPPWLLGGFALSISTLIVGYALRRRRERRLE